ncbi:MAG: hypothetical protein ACOY5F_02025 [Pseudomonadota bacterium]
MTTTVAALQSLQATAGRPEAWEKSVGEFAMYRIALALIAGAGLTFLAALMFKSAAETAESGSNIEIARVARGDNALSAHWIGNQLRTCPEGLVSCGLIVW